MRTFTVDDRRRRLVTRHFDGGTGGVADIVSDNVALHSTDPATVFLSLRARKPDLTRSDIETALYEERSVVRHLGMRRTLFVVPADPVADVHAACTVDVHVRERKRLVKMIEESDLDTGGDADAWLSVAEEAVLAALAAGGPMTATQLRDDVPVLTERLFVPRMKVDSGISTFVLSRLAMSGRISRGRPKGSWVSGTYHWHLAADWLGSEIPELDPADARARLAQRWLARFGPAIVEDLQWWAGWNKGQTRKAFAAIGAEPAEAEAEPEGEVVEAWVVAGDQADENGDDAGDERIRFLPALDGTPMGWKDRRFHLADEWRPELFDRWGNVGPTVCRGGEVIGGWGQAPDGTVRYQLFVEPVPHLIEETQREAAALTAWLDGKVVMPRFPTPLQKRLAAG